LIWSLNTDSLKLRLSFVCFGRSESKFTRIWSELSWLCLKAIELPGTLENEQSLFSSFSVENLSYWTT
jgi:hypothetical protein